MENNLPLGFDRDLVYGYEGPEPDQKMVYVYCRFMNRPDIYLELPDKPDQFYEQIANAIFYKGINPDTILEIIEVDEPRPSWRDVLFDRQKVDKVYYALKQVMHRHGRKILGIIADLNKQGIKPTNQEIWIRMRDLYQTQVSRRVHRMIDIGLIEQERQGKYVFHSINWEQVESLRHQIILL